MRVWVSVCVGEGVDVGVCVINKSDRASSSEQHLGRGVRAQSRRGALRRREVVQSQRKAQEGRRAGGGPQGGGAREGGGAGCPFPHMTQVSPAAIGPRWGLRSDPNEITLLSAAWTPSHKVKHGSRPRSSSSAPLPRGHRREP